MSSVIRLVIRTGLHGRDSDEAIRITRIRSNASRTMVRRRGRVAYDWELDELAGACTVWEEDKQREYRVYQCVSPARKTRWNIARRRRRRGGGEGRGNYGPTPVETR